MKGILSDVPEGATLNLLPDTRSIWALRTRDMLLSLFAGNCHLHFLDFMRQLLRRVNVAHHLLINSRFTEARLKLVRSTRNTALQTGLDYSFREHGDRREEIGYIGAFGADETKILKVLSCNAARSVIDYPSFCYHKDFVELVVHSISCLVRCGDNGLAVRVGLMSQHTAKLCCCL